MTTTLFLVALTMSPASAYLAFAPSPLHSHALALNAWGLDSPLSSLYDLSLHNAFRLLREPVGRPSFYELESPLLPALRIHQARPQWQDKGDHLEATFNVKFDNTAAVTAKLDMSEDVHKVTVRGAQPGMHFSRSMSLPFPVAEPSDIELEHRPQDGLFALRVRKPAEDPPKPVVELPIKRARIEASPESATEPAAVDAAAADANGQRHQEGHEQLQEKQVQQEQEQLEEKFAFVRQADADSPAASADSAAA